MCHFYLFTRFSKFVSTDIIEIISSAIIVWDRNLIDIQIGVKENAAISNTLNFDLRWHIEIQPTSILQVTII